MGLVYHGIPHKLALELKAQHRLRFFVETGTLIGKTAAWAAGYFEHVYTVEISDQFYALARNRLIGIYHNITLLHGDSGKLLPGVLAKLPGPALVWLDAHWSHDLGTAPTACPLLAEIAAVVNAPVRCVTLIDDARLFTGRDGWPALADIEAAFGYEGRVVDDVIVME